MAANWSDKAPLRALRYCRCCKPDLAHKPQAAASIVQPVASLAIRKKPPRFPSTATFPDLLYKQKRRNIALDHGRLSDGLSMGGVTIIDLERITPL